MIDIWTCAANSGGTATGQQWQILDLGSGVYQIRLQANTAKCLDDYNSETADGSNLDIWDCNGTRAQQWKFIVTIDSIVLICSTNNTNECLDIYGNKAVNGQPVTLFHNNGGGNQLWYAGGVGG